jgi:hypothetical protein
MCLWSWDGMVSRKQRAQSDVRMVDCCRGDVLVLDAPVSNIDGRGADDIESIETVVDTVKQLNSGDEAEELPEDAGGSVGRL